MPNVLPTFPFTPLPMLVGSAAMTSQSVRNSPGVVDHNERERQPAPFDPLQPDRGPDQPSNRRRREEIQRHRGADRGPIRPQPAVQRGDCRPLHKGQHRRCGEDRHVARTDRGRRRVLGDGLLGRPLQSGCQTGGVRVRSGGPIRSRGLIRSHADTLLR